MRRHRENDEGEVAGQDSFLDVVANIVGILILLVMLVGLHAGRAYNQAPPPAEPQLTTAQLDEAKGAVRKLNLEVTQTVLKANSSRHDLLQHEAERQDVALFIAAERAKVDEKKQRLSEDQRRDLELREQLLAAQVKLEDLTREQVSLASFEPQVEEIENLPTPLAKSVKDEELMIWLAKGHAKVIPMDELAEEANDDFTANLWRLESRESAVMNFGPTGGFRVRYKMRRVTITSSQGAIGTRAFREWIELRPDAADPGEPVEQAVLPSSSLMQQVKQLSPRSTTITVIVARDSFNDFRTLKRSLYELGYPVASHPIPFSTFLRMSADGTESAAQ